MINQIVNKYLSEDRKKSIEDEIEKLDIKVNPRSWGGAMMKGYGYTKPQMDAMKEKLERLKKQLRSMK